MGFGRNENDFTSFHMNNFAKSKNLSTFDAYLYEVQTTTCYH